MSAIEAPSAVIWDSLHFAYRGVPRGVRVGRHKLIEYVVKGTRITQLFDLESDPCESRNLAGQPEYIETVGALRGELERWRPEFGDSQEMGTQFGSEV